MPDARRFERRQIPQRPVGRDADLGRFSYLYSIWNPTVCSRQAVHARRLLAMAASAFPNALKPERVTILTYGGLTSEASARLTFPDLSHFRLVRLHGLRRVFAHPHLFLVRRRLIDPTQSLQLASLSVEPANGCSLAAFAFDVELDDNQRLAFMEREVEYKITTWPFHALNAAADDAPQSVGMRCGARSQFARASV